MKCTERDSKRGLNVSAMTNHVVGADERIVDSHQLDVVSLQCHSCDHTSESAEAIDANPNFLRYYRRSTSCAQNTEIKLSIKTLTLLGPETLQQSSLPKS